MNGRGGVESVVREAFEDVALAVGAVATTHRLRDGLVWNLLRRLDLVRKRTLARLGTLMNPSPAGTAAGAPQVVHPAVEAFLQRESREDGR